MASRTWRESSPSTSRTCSVSPAACCERLEKARRQVAPEPACPGFGQVDVAGDERPRRRLERHLRERLVGRHERRAVPERAVRPEQRGKRLAERATRIGDLRLGVARRQLERELEPAAAREQRQQVVEDGDAGGDVRRTGSRCDTGAHEPERTR